MSRFGEAELVARHRERLDALDIQSDLRATLAKKYDALTKDGVAAVETFRSTLEKLRAELADVDIAKIKMKPLRAALAEGFKTRLTDIEMKGSDAKKLNEAFARLLEAAASGPGALIDMAAEATSELARLRVAPDRGAQDNIAPWKLLILIAIFAVFLIGTLITAVSRGDARTIAWITTMILTIVGWVCLMIFC